MSHRIDSTLTADGNGAVEPAHMLEERFFDLSIDMLCVLGFNGYFRRLNRAWERTLGFTVEELRLRPFIEFVHPDDRARTLGQNGRVRGGGQALEFENRYLCKDGSFRWLRWNATPDPGQQLIYAVARDVTAAKNADAERERLVSQLTSALAEIKMLQGILPMCSYCRKVRDDEDYWLTVESYVSRYAQVSHGVCPDCMRQYVEPDLARMDTE
ncbi:MAG TPA: PAS domain S-box protein [Gemmatimonadaceae bacterium]|jgi:PAS domain S-box-containing protein